MRCSTKYVDLDVHQATTVATMRESSGKIIARSILPTEEAARLEFFAGMRGAIHVAFEEGTQAQWLHDLLAPRVARVVVCDRRGTPRQGNKGDQVDSAQPCDPSACRMPTSDPEPTLEVTHAEEDCSERPRAPRSLARGGE